MNNKYILALSGNDIFSGGGLHADLTTYALNGLHGFVAITCLTALTDKGFEIIPIEDDVYQKQLTSLKNIAFSGIKIGLLPNVSSVKATLEFIKQHPSIPIVLDPVLVCKEEHDREVSSLRDEILKLLPYATIVTPNLVEAQILVKKEIKTIVDIEDAARYLYKKGARYVIIKGGNRFDKNEAIDVFYDGKNMHVLKSPIVAANNIGAGCTFASSIASHLVLGKDPLEAVKAAKDFTYHAILASDQYGVVQHYEK